VLSIYFLVATNLLSTAVTQGHTNFPSLVDGAPIIAVGKITEIGEPPATWSAGGFVVAQKVKYKILTVLKGEKVGGEITVYHYLFKETPNSEKERSALTPSLFAVGKDHILFISPIKSGGGPAHPSNTPLKEFAEITSSQAAVLASEDNLREVRKALSVR